MLTIIAVLGILVIAINAERIVRKCRRMFNGWQDGCCGHNIPAEEFKISGTQACLFLSAKCPVCHKYLHKFLVNEWESNNVAKWYLPKKGTAPDEVVSSVKKLKEGLIQSKEPLGHLYRVREDGVAEIYK